MCIIYAHKMRTVFDFIIVKDFEIHLDFFLISSMYMHLIAYDPGTTGYLLLLPGKQQQQQYIYIDTYLAYTFAIQLAAY